MCKVSLNILGACVSRDIFGLNDEDGGYEIRQFLNFISPLTMFDKSICIDEDNIFSLVNEKICSQWELKCAYLDMTRGAYDYIKQKNSDYLVVDTALTRFDLNKFESGELCGCTNNNLFKFLEKNGICPKINSVVPVCSLNENELREKMLIFAEKIREIYPPERIILLEVLNAEMYYNSIDGYLYTFERMVKYRDKNKVIRFCFEVLRDALPGCHVVYMPRNVVADSLHKWGRGPMHYTMEFYKYGIEAVEIIVNNSLGGGKALEELCNEYSEIFLKKYGDATENLKKFEADFRSRGWKSVARHSLYRFMTHVTWGWVKRYFVAKKEEWWRIPKNTSS